VGGAFALFSLVAAWTRTWGLVAERVNWGRQVQAAVLSLALGALGGTVYSVVRPRIANPSWAGRAAAGAIAGVAAGLVLVLLYIFRGHVSGELSVPSFARGAVVAGAVLGALVASPRWAAHSSGPRRSAP
jgi:protein-S-isoprenylcysteine O-methyltransferase Ste14